MKQTASQDVELHREIVKLKLELQRRDKELADMTRERNLYRGKYHELKGKLHEYQQKLQQPVDITNRQKKEENKDVLNAVSNGAGFGIGEDDLLSLQIAM